MSGDHRNHRPPEEVERERLARLEATLAAEDASSAPPGDDEIAAYVDGTLDDVAREIFETRLADDPALQAEVRELRELRATLGDDRGRRSGGGSLPRWLALAAAFVVAAAAAAVLWQSLSRPSAIRLSDGAGTIAVHRDGRLEGFAPLPADLGARVREALDTGRLRLPSRIDHVRADEGALMSGERGGALLRVTQPSGTFVRSDHPVFQWSALPAAIGYRVSVFDEGLAPIVESPTLETTEWAPPSSLPRERLLLWQVEAVTRDGLVLAPSPPDPQARFQILSEADAEALQEGLNRSGGSHLVRAVLLAGAGVIDEARAELLVLKQQNPEAPVIDDLLASLAGTP